MLALINVTSYHLIDKHGEIIRVHFLFLFFIFVIFNLAWDEEKKKEVTRRICVIPELTK